MMKLINTITEYCHGRIVDYTYLPSSTVGIQNAMSITVDWMERDEDPTPRAHKTLNDYQDQLKAKKKRKKSK